MGCQSPEGGEKEEISQKHELNETIFPAFNQFPEFQFEKIQLGNTIEETKKQMASMPVEVLSENEVGHYYFPSDSTEVIIPNSAILTEFKVFLRSTTYLNSDNNFPEFLSQSAVETNTNSNFSVFHYNSNNLGFKLTCFVQDDYIRLHFIQIVQS